MTPYLAITFLAQDLVKASSGLLAWAQNLGFQSAVDIFKVFIITMGSSRKYFVLLHRTLLEWNMYCGVFPANWFRLCPLICLSTCEPSTTCVGDDSTIPGPEQLYTHVHTDLYRHVHTDLYRHVYTSYIKEQTHSAMRVWVCPLPSVNNSEQFTSSQACNVNYVTNSVNPITWGEVSQSVLHCVSACKYDHQHWWTDKC